MFPTPRSITATARWLLALLVFVALAASPAHVAAAIARAAPGGDLCSALHGAKPGRPTVPGAPAVVHDCSACAFCAASVAALPPAAPPAPAAASQAIRPVDRAPTARAGWAGVVARARGPPARG